MSNIQDLLAQILGASRGDQVRDSIADAIQMCYDDGKAGSVDLQARNLINGIMNTNELQESEIAVLQAIVAELQGGGSGGEGSSGTVTTEIPSFILDAGIVDSIGVGNNAVTNHTVTFNKTFTEIPNVFVIMMVQTTASSAYSKVSVGTIKSSITTEQFKLWVANTSGAGRSPTVGWIAIQPTTITVETDITVPATDDLTESQIQSLIGLLE